MEAGELEEGKGTPICETAVASPSSRHGKPDVLDLLCKSSWWISGQAWAELFEGDRDVVLVVGQESRFCFQGGQHLVTTQQPRELG